MIQDLTEIVNFVLEAFVHTWPYLMLSIPLAVAVRVSNASQYIRRAFVGRPLVAILLATAVGAFSPFCSCGVIPVIASLLIAGVPLGPVMAFWIASPSMDPEIFLLSVGMLGFDLAVVRVIATLILSISAGFITHYLDTRGFFSAGIMRRKSKKVDWSWRRLVRPVTALFDQLPSIPIPYFAALSTNAAAAVTVPVPAVSDADSCDTGCNSGGCEVATPQSRWEQLWSATVDSTVMVIKFMLIAFILEALIMLYIPQESIIALLGEGNPFAISASAFVGIPIYTSNLTALPLIGGLLAQGMLPGAALAFLIAGPTTTLPAMAAVYGITQKRVFAVYVTIALVGAIVLGYVYQIMLNISS